MLCGTLNIAGDEFVVANMRLNSKSNLYVILSLRPVSDPEHGKIISYWDYTQGVMINKDYIVAMYNPTLNEGYGAMTLIQTLLDTINFVYMKALKSSNVRRTQNGILYYSFENNEVSYSDSDLNSVKIDRSGLQLELKPVQRLYFNKRELNSLLQVIVNPNSVLESSTFLDSSIESLELRGFDFNWLKEFNKEYIPIHSVDDIENILIPDFIEQLVKYRDKPDWESFLVTMDFESTGLYAFDKKSGDSCDTVYLGISFQDHKAYGIFFNMDKFNNVDVARAAQLLTNMFQADPINDRDIILKNKDGADFLYKRSEIKTLAHNMLIDIRFGLLLNIDIWFDYCSMQIGFNADPFFTKGHNGVKDRVEQYFGIRYPDLGDICGKNHMGSFCKLSDLRVIQMYGCSDVDLLRLYAKILITGIRSCKDYYGVDQIDKFTEYDYLYMNFKARFDFMGVRVDKKEAQNRYTEANRILQLYYNFMEFYIGRVVKFRRFYDLYITLLKAGTDMSELEMVDLTESDPVKADKWSGKFLQDVLFTTCQYPVLVWTKQNRKSRRAGKNFKPIPAVDKEAVKHYLKIPAVKTQEEIDTALQTQKSLEDLKIASMYLTQDIIDPITNNVLVSKEQFNSYRYPFFYILQLIGPIEKDIESDFSPLINLKSDYRFAESSMASAVTRRDVSPILTVSKPNKDLYLPYSEDYYLLDADQATVEIRIVVGLTHNKDMIEPLNDPEKDPHNETAAEVFEKPAYLVDRKTERGPMKQVTFGRIYGREVYSCCMQFYGEVSPENLASTAHFLDMFDVKRADIIKVLNHDRDEMWKPREIPEFLFKFLKLNPEKKYGRMINIFGWTQHCEIREDDVDDSYRQDMRRKTGNFSVQGPAATILRILYTRMVLNFWRKGWIQDESVIPHITVYDEILLSYKSSLDPVEVILAVRDAFVVKLEDFPTLFIGVNIGSNWKNVKSDAFELPTLLVEEYKKLYKEGKRWTNIEDHPKFFLNEISEYKLRRISYELLNLNKEQKRVWEVETLSNSFSNYTVRGYLYEMNKLMFPISDNKDPVESLLSNFVYYLSKYMLSGKEVSKVICRGKVVEVNSKTYLKSYASENDLLINNPLPQYKDIEFDIDKEDSNNYDDTDNNYYNSDIYKDIDDDEEEIEPDNNEEGSNSGVVFEDSITAWDFSFMREYLTPTDFDLYSVNSRKIIVSGKSDKIKHEYKNFVDFNGTITIKNADSELILVLKKFCKERSTTSLDSSKIYASNPFNQLFKVGKIHNKHLIELDNILSNYKILKLTL